MNINYNGVNVFLTGASRGIGKVIKEKFILAGANVIAPDRDELDLSKTDSVVSYIEHNNNLNIDVFVHCAGLNKLAGIDEISTDDLMKVFQVNLFSAIQLIKGLISNMKCKREGKIIFISSLYSLVTKEYRIAYCSSKNAITGLTKTLALELAEYNIMVNAVAPGYVMTEMTKSNLTPMEIANIKENIPTQRFQKPEEIAYLILFLASQYNISITGQLIAVDGGFLCK